MFCFVFLSLLNLTSLFLCSRSSRPTYGDDAVSYVQLKRDGSMCVVKAKICPEHKVHAKLYGVTLIVDELEESVKSAECHDCVASKGGCKHAIAFLMWVHRRSEEPSCTSVQCYWMKSKLSRVGNTIKYITAKELTKGTPPLPSNTEVFEKFITEGLKRKLNDCELVKYQLEYADESLSSLSMHKLVQKYQEKSCDRFLEKIAITADDISRVEQQTRDQHQTHLWYELRYGRVTASRAHEFSRCKTFDGTLMAALMGGKIPDTPAMKRGRMLEGEVRDTVSGILGQKIKKCGLMLSIEHPMLAGSPDGICDGGVIEIKCPNSTKTMKNYIHDGKPTPKYYAQIQLQMYLTGLKNGYFCVADSNYSENKIVEIIKVPFDDKYTSILVKSLLSSWKENVYPFMLCN